MQISFTNQVALVTGAGSGIGLIDSGLEALRRSGSLRVTIELKEK